MGIKQRPDGKYEATFRDANRKEIQRTFKLKGDADRWYQDCKQDVRRGSYLRDSKETIAMRVDGWHARMKQDGLGFKTLQNYAIHVDNYIKPELGHIRTQRLTIQHCEEAALKWKDRCSANTANQVLKTLGGSLDEAVRHRVIEFNPATKAKRFKVPTAKRSDGKVKRDEVWTEAELGKLIAATAPGTLDRLLVWLGGFCGLRIGEILGFSWAAIDLKATPPMVNVIKNLVSAEKSRADFPGYKNTGRTLKDPKNHSVRVDLIKAPAEMVHDLRLWKLKCPQARPQEWTLVKDGRVIEKTDPLARQLIMLTVEGKPLQTKAAQKILNETAARAKVAPRTLHRLRHSYASALLDDGEELQTVSRLLGHRDIGITASRYSHFTDKGSTASQDLATRALATAKAAKEGE